MKKVIVVGAGIGGLCTAIRLLNKGYDVTIIEKENSIGGKVNIRCYGEFKFDLTASILMTPQIYIDIFKECNRDYKDYFKLIKLDETVIHESAKYKDLKLISHSNSYLIEKRENNYNRKEEP